MRPALRRPAHAPHQPPPPRAPRAPRAANPAPPHGSDTDEGVALLEATGGVADAPQPSKRRAGAKKRAAGGAAATKAATPRDWSEDGPLRTVSRPLPRVLILVREEESEGRRERKKEQLI
jgi:hypothetical protein